MKHIKSFKVYESSKYEEFQQKLKSFQGEGKFHDYLDKLRAFIAQEKDPQIKALAKQEFDRHQESGDAY